jgi:hypothetical protein
LETWNEFFRSLLINPSLHAKWLNSLSYLEYRGARKIARALKTEHIDEGILKHMMEEFRHALYFKRLAMRLGGKVYRTYAGENLLAEKALKSYFYELDAAAERAISHSEAKKEVYLLVTWLIEERALKVYLAYEALLQSENFELTLKPVLADETHHLRDAKDHLLDLLEARNIDIEPLLETEEQLFKNLFHELSREAFAQKECHL